MRNRVTGPCVLIGLLAVLFVVDSTTFNISHLAVLSHRGIAWRALLFNGLMLILTLAVLGRYHRYWGPDDDEDTDDGPDDDDDGDSDGGPDIPGDGETFSWDEFEAEFRAYTNGGQLTPA